MPRETPTARRLREETAAQPQASMQIGPDQAAFMAMLVCISGVRRALEIGTLRDVALWPWLPRCRWMGVWCAGTEALEELIA